MKDNKQQSYVNGEPINEEYSEVIREIKNNEDENFTDIRKTFNFWIGIILGSYFVVLFVSILITYKIFNGLNSVIMDNSVIVVHSQGFLNALTCVMKKFGSESSTLSEETKKLIDKVKNILQ
ncbi:hypothetical protein HERIO_283 [Hepatospora eriocheir]|uniref:Uncharacterized protein n=1 Tax=Hepatospora eriocheir TaxID=1081669 RepID=A0A1X0QDM5_9MICR|nr:hypothetical protein HERIO_283 [Hepatospora eriocheir]